MRDSTIKLKISEFIENHLLNELENLLSKLDQGLLMDVEMVLMDRMKKLYTELLGELLQVGAREHTKRFGKLAGFKQELRSHQIRIATGAQIMVSSIYLKQVPPGYAHSRRPLNQHWCVIKGNSPLLLDRVCFMAMLAPSYDLAYQALNKFGVSICRSSVAKITTDLANHCEQLGHEELIVEASYSVASKKVVISIDGGRSRTRAYNGLRNKYGNCCYDTAWREPKLFVIDILDEHGRVHREELPIYGCRFSEQNCLELLQRYLARIQIHQAKNIQLIADGASWIWNRVPALLMDLGVKKEQLIETLDYYHAAQYVHSLVDQLPKKVSTSERKSLLNKFIEQVKNGEVKAVIEKIQSIFIRKSDIVKRWINYLDKHRNRMQYAEYQSNGFMRGSGIIESAIRRIINLRFKNASTFWLEENVEKLYFLRAALVAGRWDILMKNIVRQH